MKRQILLQGSIENYKITVAIVCPDSGQGKTDAELCTVALVVSVLL